MQACSARAQRTCTRETPSGAPRAMRWTRKRAVWKTASGWYAVNGAVMKEWMVAYAW
jgi:hypothetical protein